MTNIAEQITKLELDLLTATGAKVTSLQRRIDRLRAQQAAETTTDTAETTGDGANAPQIEQDQTTDTAADDTAAAAEPIAAIIDAPTEVAGQDTPDGDATTVAATGDDPEPNATDPVTADPAKTVTQPAAALVPAQPAAPRRPRLSLADKVIARASELAAHPMPLEEGSKFAPARRVETGMFLSGDGQLLIARHGDGWRVSEFEVTDGEVRVVGEATEYPTAQQALAAVRVQMTAGVA